MQLVGNWMERLALKAQMEEELLPGQSVVELLGDSRVLVEQHKGVTVFGGEQICIRLKFGILQICGSQLQVEKMSSDFLVVTGKIDSLKILRR